MEIKFCGTVDQIKSDIAAFMVGFAVPAPPQVEPEAPKERVPKGRKGVASNPSPEPAPEPVNATVPQSAPVVEQAPFPSEKDVQDAVVNVNAKFGIDKAIECLTKFGVKRARELREDQRADFISHCTEVLK